MWITNLFTGNMFKQQLSHLLSYTLSIYLSRILIHIRQYCVAESNLHFIRVSSNISENLLEASLNAQSALLTLLDLANSTEREVLDALNGISDLQSVVGRVESNIKENMDLSHELKRETEIIVKEVGEIESMTLLVVSTTSETNKLAVESNSLVIVIHFASLLCICTLKCPSVIRLILPFFFIYMYRLEIFSSI
jgi:hypothetical protein